MPKRSLRQQMLAWRRALSHDEWHGRSMLAQQNLLSLDEYRLAPCIALYSPVHKETDTAEILATAFNNGKRVLYPVVCNHEMLLREITGLDNFTKGHLGILEPCHLGPDLTAVEADLIVVPGVAFDQCGHRIGYGKGFYDQFLSKSARKGHLIGLCHDFQLLDEQIPAEGHDIRMEIVVTDKRIIRVVR